MGAKTPVFVYTPSPPIKNLRYNKTIPNENRTKGMKERYGRLVVLEEGSICLCQCDCGTVKRIKKKYLVRGSTRSCGCLRKERCKKELPGLKHGMSKHPDYWIWRGILTRCLNQNNESYKYYGERGIKICERWMDFSNFIKDMGERQDLSLSIDRINNDGDYEPRNCRWATLEEQNNNRRDTVLIEYNGETLSLTQWARKLGINKSTLKVRISRYGWSIHRAFTEPVGNSNNYLSAKSKLRLKEVKRLREEERLTFKEIGERLGFGQSRASELYKRAVEEEIE